MVWTVLNDCDDKTTLPNYLKDLYSREPQQVDSLLSTLINPYDSKNSLDVEKCLWVICGGQKPEDFTRIIKSNDRSVICGLVWDANFIAYRCKTCGITPCMSLCAECFENGDHEGHDFNMFKSGAGGACDCGDVEVMKPCGFCSRHGPKSAKSYREIPDDVTLMVNLVVPKLIDFLLFKLEYATTEKPNKVDRGDEEVAKLLLQLCEMGDITRNVVAQGMLQVRKKNLSSDGKVVFKGEASKPNIHKYTVMRRQSSTENSQPSSLPDSGIQNISDGEGAPLQSVADSILSLPGPSKDCDLPYLGYEEEKKTVLETLLDLLIELKFPQYLVTLVLSMLQEADYKQQFMEAFCSRYAKIANLLTHRFEPEEDQKLCNRLVHASVQLFSNENLTFKMVQNNNLLSIIVSALSDLISRTLIKVDHDTEDNVNSKSLFVVNCNHDIISQHRYWPVVSDFHNLLSHNKIARHFLGEAALIRRWMGILTHFTGMNKNIRHLIVHIPYESNVYQYAYSTEIEASSHIMTNLLSVCSSPSESDHIRLVLSECVRALRSWFRMIQVQIVKPFLEPLNGEEFTPSGPIPRHEITFHLPLHRYLAGFISQAINYCGMSLEEVLPSEEVLWCVMEHVLRIQVGIGEILSGLWVRNGYSLRSQEEFYLQGQYCNQCVDLDIFLLQVCVMALDSDLFLTTLLQRYKLDSWFRFGDFASTTQPADNDVQQALVESMLNLILQLVYQRMYMGLSEEKMVHLEVVTKLTMGDFTHSQLTDNLPEKPGISELTELFDEVLSKVSDYKQPTNESGQLTQGIYALKPDLWKSEFQPLHVMLRGSYKRGYQLAMDKYKGWYQSQNKTKVQGLWPPFRTPLALNPQCKPLFRVLHSRTLHAMLFTVLYKAMKETDTVNDNMIYLTFYLVDLCIDAPEDIATPVLERGSLKPDITVAEQEDGTVPQAIVKCILFLQEHRDLPTLYKGKAVEQRVQELCRKLISSPHTFIIKPDQYSLQDVTEALLLMCNSRLQPPLFARLYNAAKQLSLTTGIGTAMYDKKTHMYHIQQVLEQLPPHRYKMINLLIYYLSTLVKEEIATLHQICAVYVPEGVDHTAFSSIIRCYDWIFRVRKRHSDSLESMFDIKYKSDRIVKNAYQCVMGTSLVQCMYEIRKKLSQIDFSQSPGSSNAYTTHNGVEAITKILEKLCERDQNNAKLLRSLERADASTPDRSTSPCSTSEAKRKRAKERQAKLLQQFASKQRIFEAQMEAENLVPFAEEEPSEAKQSYSCIICSIDSVNTELKPIATFVLCQPASLLLHCTAPQSERAIMDERFEDIPTLHSTLHDHYNTLKMLFTSASTWQGVGQRAQPGLHVQSCCHYLHVECYKTYSDSQRSRSSDPLHNPLKGKELSCPTCRRLSNTVLPLPPEPFFKPYTPTEVKVPVSPATQIPLPFTHSCLDKSYLTSNPLTCLGCSSHKLHAKIKQVMQQAPIDLVNATILQATKTPYYLSVEQFVNSLEDYYKKYVEQKSVSQQDILVLSLHTTLQCELIERNKTLLSDLECSRKYCTGRLISVLATQSSMLIECHSSNDLLLELIGMLHSGGPGPSKSGKKASSRLPLVLQEPSWILLKFVLFSKLQSDWENFVTVVRLLFTLQTMRALHSVVAKFSQDEQLAYSRKNVAECDDFQALLGVTCRELSRLGVHATVGEMDITSYVWSLQSIETNIQSLCLPLLREAVLLGHHMYEKPLPTTPPTCSELLHLAAWLDLIPSSNVTSSSSTVKVLNLPRDLLLKFSCDLVGQLPLPRDMPHSPLSEPLMPLVQNWGRPRLLTLPRLYGKLYLHYRHVKCRVCKGVPHDPALCLVCGQLVCVRSQCCQWLNTGECTKHAQKCGAGTAIYLVIMSSTVVIIRGERVYLWGSVYLDQHDEEDIDLKRGKPLYLSETRYNCLNQQWISHSFDHTLKRWGWHQQQF